MYKYHLNDVEWGEFKVGNLFELIEKGKCSNEAKQTKYSDEGVSYLSATNRNNGVSNFVERTNLVQMGNCIMFVNQGDGGAGYSVYKREDFIATTSTSFGYGRTENRLLNDRIMLPIDEKNNPNWHFMEEYIKERENKQREYLKEYYKNRLLDLLVCPEVLTDVEWRDFFVSDVFDTVQRGKRLTKANQIDGETPYISSIAFNNGVDNFVGNTENIRKSDHDLTIANSVSVGACFYHNYEYISSDHVTSLKLANGNDTVYKFISVILGRLEEKYSFNREINDSRIKREKLLLPIDKNGNPNWIYMENFIKNIEQKQIKNILKYLDEYI